MIGLLLLLFIAVCVAVFYYRFAYSPFQVLKRCGIKGPTPSFFYGNFKDRLKVGYMKFTEQCHMKFGPIFGAYIGTIPIVTITDLELVKLVAIKDSDNFINRPDLRDMMDKKSIKLFGLVQERDQAWRTARNTISPTFSASKLKAMTPIIVQGAETLSNILVGSAASDIPVDISQIYGRFAMESILSTAFGHKIYLQLGESDSLATIAGEAFNSQQETKNTSGQMLSVILSNLPWLTPIARFFVQRSSKVKEFYTLGEMARDLIKKRRSEQQPGEYKDFLQLLIEATVEDENGRKMNDDEITSHCILFMIAGYETTSNALTYTAYQLALNPNIQQKLQAEIDEYFKNNPDSTPYQACMDIAYLDMVIQESLRLYPPVPRFNRECSKDYHYQNITIPAASHVVVPNFLIQRDPKYWVEPERFDPLRFTTEEKAKRPQLCHLPFGLGPRNCLGMRLALLEAKIALIEVMKKISFLPCLETEVPLKTVVGITMVPINGVFLKVVHRT